MSDNRTELGHCDGCKIVKTLVQNIEPLCTINPQYAVVNGREQSIVWRGLCSDCAE